MLKNVEVIDEQTGDSTIVHFGSKVTVKDLDLQPKPEVVTYAIKGASEADALNGKISNISPLGKALLGHKAGDIVEVDAPAGMIKYEILEIK